MAVSTLALIKYNLSEASRSSLNETWDDSVLCNQDLTQTLPVGECCTSKVGPIASRSLSGGPNKRVKTDPSAALRMTDLRWILSGCTAHCAHPVLLLASTIDWLCLEIPYPKGPKIFG